MVGGVENHLGRPVILLELDDLRIRVVLLERKDVAHVRAAKRVDRLVVVAHDGQIPELAAEVAHHQVLRPVGVLVFVDHDVFEALLIFLEHLRVAVEEPDGAHQEIIEVERMVLLEKGVVAEPDPRRQLLVVGTRRLQLVVSIDDLVFGS